MFPAPFYFPDRKPTMDGQVRHTAWPVKIPHNNRDWESKNKTDGYQ